MDGIAWAGAVSAITCRALRVILQQTEQSRGNQVDLQRSECQLELLAAVSEIIGIPSEPDFRPGRTGDVRDSEADIRCAADLLGYRVIVPFVEGLRATLGK